MTSSTFHFILVISGNDQHIEYMLKKMYEEDEKIYVVLKEINSEESGFIYFIIPTVIFPYFVDRVSTSFQKHANVSLKDLGKVHFVTKSKTQPIVRNIIIFNEAHIRSSGAIALTYNQVASEHTEQELIDDINYVKSNIHNKEKMESNLQYFVDIEQKLIQGGGSKISQESVKCFKKQPDGTFVYDENRGIAQRLLGYDFDESVDGFFYKNATNAKKQVLYHLIIEPSFIETFLAYCKKFV